MRSSGAGIYIYIYVYSYVYARTHTHTQAHIHTHTHARSTHTHTHTYTNVHTYTQTRTHTRTRQSTHAHTSIKARPLSQTHRQRIERLERELRHVENLPALEVDRYAATARYGMRGVEAAVQTIQGAWRAVVRARRRRTQRSECRDRAARVLQAFFKKYPKLRKQRCAARAPSPPLTPVSCTHRDRHSLSRSFLYLACLLSLVPLSLSVLSLLRRTR